MLIPEIPIEIVNKLQFDIYGQVSGVFLLNKPVGITSHDLVDQVRKILQTRKVGHAGTLDPFASGLLILLVGKYTKYTEALIEENKEYFAEVVLGIKTLTQDPEGLLLENVNINKTPVLKEKVKAMIKNFPKKYLQRVPIFSSVKVQGYKLRVLAHSAEKIEIIDNQVYFHIPATNKSKAKIINLNLPTKEVNLYKLELGKFVELKKIKLAQGELQGNYTSFKITVGCSKGTYIRQLAEDFGTELNLPAFLYNLERTKIAEFTLDKSLTIEQLAELVINDGQLSGNKV